MKRECERLSRHRNSESRLCLLLSLLLVFPFGSVWKLQTLCCEEKLTGSKSGLQFLTPETDAFSVFCLLNKVESLAWP